MSEYVKGKCIYCGNIVDISSLSDGEMMMRRIIIDVICKDCRKATETEEEEPKKSSRRRKVDEEDN